MKLECPGQVHSIAKVVFASLYSWFVSLQVLYPDGQAQIIHPKPSDFRNPGPGRHRLITQVYLSHGAWTEPCQIEVRLLLAYDSSTRICRPPCLDSAEALPLVENSIEGTIPFSKPVKVYIMPKPARRWNLPISKAFLCKAASQGNQEVDSGHPVLHLSGAEHTSEPMGGELLSSSPCCYTSLIQTSVAGCSG